MFVTHRCILAIAFFAVSAYSAGVTIDNSWEEGGKRKLTANIELTAPCRMNSWSVILDFSATVLTFETWRASNGDSCVGQKSCELTNKYSNWVEDGATLKFNFMAKFDTSRDPTINAKWGSVCGGKVTDGPTIAPPTNGPTDGPTNRPTVEPPGPTGAPPTGSPPINRPKPGPMKYNYADVLGKSILFFEAQRSGKLAPHGNLVGQNRIKWRGDSGLADGRDVGKDLTGGWYDAGDHVKFNFPMSSATTIILWGMIKYERAYKKYKEWPAVVDSIKWPLDYFVKCHVSDNELYGQVGDGHADHAFWGRPEDMRMNRPAWKIHAGAPGSDLAGETAAAMAAGSIAFKRENPSFSADLLRRARKLYNFAKNHQGLYHNSITNAQSFYRSNGFKDELAWSAAWLHKATGEAGYLNDAKNVVSGLGTPGELSWDDKTIGAALLVLEADPSHGPSRNAAEGFVKNWLYSVRRTPKGLAWLRKWGPNRYSANAVFMLQVAADLGIKTNECWEFAEKQINYMLGDNGRSYVVGYGNNPPQRPHHRGASCPNRPAHCDWNNEKSPGPNPQILVGALVGGPGANDDYEDRRNDYIKNEVATDYNAAFQSALAGLLERYV